MKKLPDKIYVTIEGERNEQWLYASDTADSVGDGVRVGVYQLSEIVTKKIEHSLIGLKRSK